MVQDHAGERFGVGEHGSHEETPVPRGGLRGGGEGERLEEGGAQKDGGNLGVYLCD